MQLKLREGILGDYYQFPVFEIDFAGMLTNLPSAFTTGTNIYSGTNSDGKTFDTLGSGEDVLYVHRARITSSNLYQYMPPEIPHQRNQYGVPTGVDGAILNFNTNIQRGTTYPYAGYGMEEVAGGQPSDYNTNFHYAWFDTQNSNGFDGGNSRVGMTYDPSSSGAWETSSRYKNVLDKNCSMFHQFYTGVGSCHFSVSKRPALYSYYGSSLAWYAPGIAVCVPARSSSTDSTDVKWCMCNKSNIPLRSMTNGKRFGYAFAAESSSAYGSENNYTQKQNVWQFFVHYQIGGRDFYGICQAYFTTGWNDQDYPTMIDLLTLGTEFWGDSITPGGGYHPGEWGSKTVIGGGQGTFHNDSDNRSSDTAVNNITVHVSQVRDSIGAGIHRNVSSASSGTELVRLGAGQFTTLSGMLYTPGDFWDNWENKYFDPLSCILTCHAIPVEFIDDAPTTSNVCIAGHDFTSETGSLLGTAQDISSHVCIASDEVSMERFFDAFPDFEGYTRCTLHIPFIGDVSIPTNAIAHGAIRLIMTCDVRNGNLACCVWAKGSPDAEGTQNSGIILTATGNCSTPMPLAMTSHDGLASIGKMVGGIVATAAGIAAAMATPGGAAAIPGIASASIGAVTALSGGAELVNNKMDTRVYFSNSCGFGTLGDNRIYLEIERPEWVETDHYQDLKGIPAPFGGTILTAPYPGGGSGTYPYDGFTVFEDIDLDSLSCTDAEKELIAQKLKSGVYIHSDRFA